MTKVLLVDDEKGIREILEDILIKRGYEVIEAKDGSEGIEKACQERPDIILLDVIMPVMDGFEVLGKLRENPATESVPVILLTALSAARGESAGMRSGVTHYLTKPWKPGSVELAVRVALREAAADSSGERPVVSNMIKTGVQILDQKLGGGIPLGSITLIEGVSGSGKSVLCQQLAYGALRMGHRVTCFTSENTVKSLTTQMASIGMDISHYLRAEKLIIDIVEDSSDGKDVELQEDPEHLLSLLAQNIERSSGKHSVVIVDSITNLASYSEDRAVLGFFSSCKRLCDEGTTILLVAHSAAFTERLLVRLRSLCDAHLSLRVERLGETLAKTLEVCKVHNAEQTTSNMVSFDVEPGIGMRVLPMARVKV